MYSNNFMAESTIESKRKTLFWDCKTPSCQIINTYAYAYNPKKDLFLFGPDLTFF